MDKCEICEREKRLDGCERDRYGDASRAAKAEAARDCYHIGFLILEQQLAEARAALSTEKLFRDAMQAGFKGGWAAACLTLADECAAAGVHEFAQMLRERAHAPPQVQTVEVVPDWPCTACGHSHARNMGGICVGCPCAERPPVEVH